MKRSAALLLALFSLSAPAAAAPSLVRDAAIDISRLTQKSAGLDELRAGVGAMRDGDTSTAFTVTGDIEGFVELDWTAARPNGSFAVSTLTLALGAVVDGSMIHAQAGADAVSLVDVAATVSVSGTTAVVTIPSGMEARVVRVFLPTSTEVIELDASATSDIAPSLGVVSSSCETEGARLSWGDLAAGTRGVEVRRDDVEVGYTRRASLLDAAVRFAPRPQSPTYLLTPVGWDGSRGTTQAVTAQCSGPGLPRPSGAAIHGVIEGFYGRPWTWEERRRVVLAMSGFGLDTYVYAPKNDPLHRDQWRQPYPAAALDEFRALAAAGRLASVSVVYAISPGLDVKPGSDADLQALLGKISAMNDVGIRDAVLSLDDISSPPTKELGAFHASLATSLLTSLRARDPAARLWLVPTVYSGRASELSAAQRDYLTGLSALPPDVGVAWTGIDVFAAEVRGEDAVAFGALAGRSPSETWVWDNYPVNDVALERRLYAFPVPGRQSVLPMTGGLVSNPMMHALASLPAISSYGDLASDPADYVPAVANGQPNASRALSLELATGADSPQEVALFFDELAGHPILLPGILASPALSAAMSSYVASHDPASATTLASHLARLWNGEGALRTLDVSPLSDELDAHTRLTAALAKSGLAALGGQGPSSAERCRWAALQRLRWKTIGDALAPLFPGDVPTGCDDSLDPLDTHGAPVAGTVGSAMVIVADDTAGGTATWSVVGPEGASVDGQGAVKLVPKAVGVTRLVALRTSASGVSASLYEVSAGRAIGGAGTGGAAGMAGVGGSMAVAVPIEAPVIRSDAEGGGCGLASGSARDRVAVPAWMALGLLLGWRRRILRPRRDRDA